MRVILILWAIPIIFFWGWYGLSAYDINFGLKFLTREFHDLIFRIYSNMIGLPAEDIPGWLAWIFFVDSLIVLGVAALRWYKHWLPQTVSWLRQKCKPTQPERELFREICKPLVRKPENETVSDSSGQVRPAE